MRKEIESYLKDQFKQSILPLTDEETATFLIDSGVVADVASELKTKGFDHLSDVTVVDYIDEGEFEVIYHLWSHGNRQRLIIKTRIPREKAVIASLAPVWTSAHMHERECHEMFGIEFEGHDDLTPLLLEDWEEMPPLRKDFDSRKYVLEKFYGGERE